MSKGTTNIPAVFVLVQKDTKVLLVLRQNTGWRDGDYTMPSGHVEDRESFLQAAQRELLEEVGLKSKANQLQHRLTLHERKDAEVRIGMTFELLNWSGEPYNAEPHVHGEVGWFAVDNLPSNIVPQALFSLEQIKAGNTYAEYGWNNP